MRIWPGEIYLLKREKPRPIIVVSREELNRGASVVAVPLTTAHLEERAAALNCVRLDAGDGGRLAASRDRRGWGSPSGLLGYRWIVRRHGRHEVEVVRMEPEDAEQPRKTGEVAVDYFLQIGHAAPAPILEPLRREQAHADEDIDRGNDIPFREEGGSGAYDPRVERIVSIPGKCCRCPAVLRLTDHGTT